MWIMRRFEGTASCPWAYPAVSFVPIFTAIRPAEPCTRAVPPSFSQFSTHKPRPSFPLSPVTSPVRRPRRPRRPCRPPAHRQYRPHCLSPRLTRIPLQLELMTSHPPIQRPVELHAHRPRHPERLTEHIRDVRREIHQPQPIRHAEHDACVQRRVRAGRPRLSGRGEGEARVAVVALLGGRRAMRRGVVVVCGWSVGVAFEEAHRRVWR